MRCFKIAFGLVALAIASGCQTLTGASVTTLADGQSGTISFPATQGSYVTGDLDFPDETSTTVPAIIMVHGSGGKGFRQDQWGSFLRKNGFATFSMDYFSPRGVRAPSTRPPSPYFDIIDAQKVLRTHPRIDAERIAAIGWSNGAGMVLASVSVDESRAGGPTLQAYIALYPVCQFHSIPYRAGPSARVLVLLGTEDSFTSVENCTLMMEQGRSNGHDAEMIVYDGAYHGWDGDYRGSFRYGNFGTVTIIPDSAVTACSRQDVIEFLAPML